MSIRRRNGEEAWWMTVERAEWEDIDWREHQRWVHVDGVPANLVDVGDGPPLIFVHGLSGCWQNWLESIPAFARDHRVIAVDLPGFGHSPMPRERITISGYGRWLDRLFDALGIEGAAVVGNSMGGFIAAETAIKFPHRVERLGLVAAAGLSIERRRSDTLLRALEASENVIQILLARTLARADWLVRRPRGRRALMGFVVAHPHRLSPALVQEQIRGANKPGFLPALDALTSYPIRDRIPDIECPTLIVWGPKDILVPIRDAYEFERLIPDARLCVYDDTGHLPQLERPEQFNADLRAFLTEQPDDPGEREAEAAAQQSPSPRASSSGRRRAESAVTV
jgi:pimeloyl-ACP methyl ester carboxylesterase